MDLVFVSAGGDVLHPLLMIKVPQDGFTDTGLGYTVGGARSSGMDMRAEVDWQMSKGTAGTDSP